LNPSDYLAGGHKINAMLKGKVLDGLHVLVSCRGASVQCNVREVHNLALSHDTIIEYDADDSPILNALHSDPNGPVAEADGLARGDNVNKVQEVNPQAHLVRVLPVANKRILQGQWQRDFCTFFFLAPIPSIFTLTNQPFHKTDLHP
jgi:hypothetical protein